VQQPRSPFEFLTAIEIAAEVPCSVVYAQRLIKAGTLPSVATRLGSLVRRADLDAYLEQRSQLPTDTRGRVIPQRQKANA
jgi:excisionase family DNA binding protein